MIAFLQRMFGYALTGETREHALFFGHGVGANGKSLIANTLRGVMGDYATVAPAQLLLASKNEQHPTELADLRGARLVVASEIDEGQRWNEARIKSLTGGDPIKARLMRQDFFEYQPQFKLLIVANHRPSLGTVDEAMRRRMNFLPFDVVIPPAERDPELSEKLKVEWPAILRWGIEGCLEWQRGGLRPPESVVAATTEYLAEQDVLEQWFGECCERAAGAVTASSALYQSWRRWRESRGEPVWSQRRFVSTFKERHTFRHVHTRDGSKFEGLQLRPQPEPPPHEESILF